MLLMDNLVMHVSEKIINLLIKQYIYPLYFPSKTTHILQSCDDIAFEYFISNITTNYRKQVICAIKYEPICIIFVGNHYGLIILLTLEIITRPWYGCEFFYPNQYKIIERRSLLKGKEKVKTICNEIVVILINIINNVLRDDDSEIFPIPQGINDQILHEEFIQNLK